MAGEAKTEEFNFTDATVMIGPMDDVMNLTPTEHSIGLIRNIAVTSNLTKTNLPQGIRNVTVHSTVTGSENVANFEVYEYTAKNMAYALGIEVATYAAFDNHTLAEAIVGDGILTDTIKISSTVDITDDYPVGSWVTLSATTTGDADLIFLAKVVSRTYSGVYEELTVELDAVIPVGMNFSIGDLVARQNQIPVGKKESQEYFGMKITATLPEGKPITLILPKVQIRNGFNLGFITDNYSNMPFEFECFELLPVDSLYSDFGDEGILQTYSNS